MVLEVSLQQTELIPVQIDENSPVEFITMGELIKVVSDQLYNQNQIYLKSSDDEKQEILSNLALEYVKTNPSILDQEVVQCTLNKLIYNLLRTFYIPDSISKTIASWTMWFLRGLKSITWNFFKTTCLYMLNNIQIILLLFTVMFPLLQYTLLPLSHAATDHLIHLQAGNLIRQKEAHQLIQHLVTLNTGNTIVNILDIMKIGSTIYFTVGSGKLIYNYIKELHSSLSDINANCLIQDIPISPKIKEQIEQQVHDAFKNIKQTDAIKRAVSDSKELQMIPESRLEQQFVEHVENAVVMTPINEITNVTSNNNIDNITPEKYTEAIVGYTVKLIHTSVQSDETSSSNNETGMPLLQPQYTFDKNVEDIRITPHATSEPQYEQPFDKNMNEYSVRIVNPQQDAIVQNISRELNKQYSVILA